MDNQTLKVGRSRNQCRSCSKFFNSLAGFEKHRIGEFGVDRRCATTEEMYSRDMSINTSGYWIGSVFDRVFNEDEE